MRAPVSATITVARKPQIVDMCLIVAFQMFYCIMLENIASLAEEINFDVDCLFLLVEIGGSVSFGLSSWYSQPGHGLQTPVDGFSLQYRLGRRQIRK